MTSEDKHVNDSLKDAFDRLESNREAPKKLEEFMGRPFLGERKTKAASQRLPLVEAKRELATELLRRIVSEPLPIFLKLEEPLIEGELTSPNMKAALSLKSMISTRLSATERSLIKVSVVRPTLDDSLIVVAIVGKSWRRKQVELAVKEWIKER